MLLSIPFRLTFPAFARRKVIAWAITLLGIAVAIGAIFLRLDIATEELLIIARQPWCLHGTWRRTSVSIWGPTLLLPCFVAWFHARHASIPVWPARLAAVLATAWWFLGSTASYWPRWLL